VLDSPQASRLILVEAQKVIQLFEIVFDPPTAREAADDLLRRHAKALGEKDVHARLLSVVPFAHGNDAPRLVGQTLEACVEGDLGEGPPLAVGRGQRCRPVELVGPDDIHELIGARAFVAVAERAHYTEM